MGGCLSLSIELMCPKTSVAFNICQSIPEKLEKVGFNSLNSFTEFKSLHTWRFKVYDCKIFQNIIAKKIVHYMIENKVKAFNLNGLYEDYMATHIGIAIMSSMVNPDYKFKVIKEIPVDTVFYSIGSISKEEAKSFYDVFYVFPEQDISPNTENKSEHKLLNYKLETIIIKTIENLDLENVIKKTHKSFMTKTNENKKYEETLFKINT